MSQFLSEIRDLTYLEWRVGKNSSGTVGTFLKAESVENGRHLYFKLSDYDNATGIVGHESINELIASRLLDEINIVHTNYDLLWGDIVVRDKKINGAYVCVSEDFKENGDRKIALDDYYSIKKKSGESPFEFCVRMGWREYIEDMLLCDYLILNRDRHGANIELLIKSNGDVVPAPLFDHGLSLMCRALTDDEIDRYDVLEDKPVQSFVGGRSVKENLSLIRPDHMKNIGKADTDAINRIMDGLIDPLGEKRYNKIKKMLEARWDEYYDIYCDRQKSSS